MSWGKVSDRLHSHSKARRAREAMALWVLALSWSCDELTGGAVPSDMPEIIMPGIGDGMAARLVAVGLWERTPDGYRFHDWQDFQPDAAAEKERRERISKVRADAGARGNAQRWGAQTDRKTIAPTPIEDPTPTPTPTPPASGTGTERGQPEPSSEAPRCATVERLGTDPHEVAAIVGRFVPRLVHFPGGMRDAFRAVTAPLRIDWRILGQWLAAGGVRRHRSERVTWSWLLGHGGGPLAECWALAQEWDAKGRPALDERGEIAPTKSTPAEPARPAPSPLAWLAGAPPKITPEAARAARAAWEAKRVANG